MTNDFFVDSCGKVDVIDKFSRQLAYVLKKSKFYIDKYKAVGVDTNKDLKITDLPFTEKKEVLEDQEKNSPFGSNLCVDISDIQRIHSTSGTTSKPFVIALTKKDIENTVKAGSKCFKTSGLKNNDVVIHCLNYCMWAGGYTDHQSLEAAGAAVIPFGVGNSSALIETIKNLNVTAISCTPSYLAKLELLMKEEFKIKPKDLKLRIGLFGAESGLQDPNFRKKIEDTWGMKAMNANYGMADVLSMFGAECEKQDGLHFISEGNLLVELLNPATMQIVPLKNGAKGELVLTNLTREAQPLIRYRSHDVIEIISTERCSCGLESFRFNIIGRSDDMLVIKGLNVFPNQIRNIINKHLGALSGEFEILLTSAPPIEELVLNVEYLKETDKAKLDATKHILEKEMKMKLCLDPKITFVKEGSIPRSEGKTKRIRAI